MIKKRQAKGISLALVAALSGGIVPISFDQTQVAYAAVAEKSELTREEAVKRVEELITIPQGATLDDVRYEEPHPTWGNNFATWNLNWRGSDDLFINATLEAKTGKLINFNIWNRKDKPEKEAGELSEEDASKIALAFLKRVAPDEVGSLSKPNEFVGNDYYRPFGLSQKNVHFTRVENEIPLLENGFNVVVNARKEVIGFDRKWTDAKLPEPTTKLTKEQGEKLLEELVKPSLLLKRIPNYTDLEDKNPNLYSLVYQYGVSDPMMIDAQSGIALNPVGTDYKTAKPIAPLGDTVKQTKPGDKVITQQEAQKIAEGWIKKFPGKYRSEGSHGGGASTDSAGVTIRNWSFQFVLDSSTNKKDRGIELRINERGEFVGYQNEAKNNLIFGEGLEKIDNPISWKTAEQKAVAFIKNIYSDRLGELYVMDQEPSAEVQKEMFDNEDQRTYSIRFGWLHKGIPIENEQMSIEIDPRDGEVVQFWTGREGFQGPEGKVDPVIDAKQAVEVESKEKRAMLTYFQAGFDYRYGIPSTNSKPILVFRYVGDAGAVDALTGKWINFSELQKQQSSPQDIANHPLKDIISYAIDHDILQVADGKVEPDRAVTRGEFVSVLIKMTNRIEFHSHHRSNLDEETIEFTFTDVPTKHPYRGFIQQAMQAGLIHSKKGNFEPDRPITRLEAAEMVVKFIRFETLLENKEIFNNPFTDVDSMSAPVAVIASSVGFIQPKSPKEFKPSQPLTRAEVAQIYHQLIEKFGEE